ncbi:hypothetical protein RN001_014644 [Aquatica leii]|uniref:Nuclease HARBI1 n=1 Tax=Aquatica leii TaxID=1421715 RepID=A0AAN7PYP4_9COLE|nr:hypothetical protein RN001_014644 [Aquatica leii]
MEFLNDDLDILDIIENGIPRRINNSVSPLNQLLTTLRFYATDGHLSSVADFMGIHTSSASRIIKKTSQVLASLRPRYIRMPQNEEIVQVQNHFFQIASFP